MADLTIDDLLPLWAKSGRGEDGMRNYHPLLCHLIDVAQVTRAIWDRVLPSSARRRIAGELGVDEDAAGAWVSFWAGLHDLGKASPSFQGRRGPFRRRLQDMGWTFPSASAVAPHGAVSAVVLEDLLATDFGLPAKLAMQVATVVGGHHGVFPSSDLLNRLDPAAVGKGRWSQARGSLAATLAAVLGVPRDRAPVALDNAPAMWLAGLISVADWIGSNPAYLHLTDPATANDVADYADRAQHIADEALEGLGWTARPRSTEARSFGAMFEHIPAPNALQESIIPLADRLDAPIAVVIEAPMGEGKTEAAMYLADRWGLRLGASGCYFALPTQATSNQMFDRVRDFLAARYATDLINLQLMHGQAALSPAFARLRKRWERSLAVRDVHGDPGYDGAPPEVVAAEWFTGHKRGLLSPFGVGTVDQALLAVLQTRHVFVRLFGLSNRTVVIDEVHAYDAYMTTLLERLLEWLAALGSSVVLLSATLPAARRQALLAAYRRGLRAGDQGEAPPTRYPRVSWANAREIGAVEVATSTAGTKSIGLDWVDGEIPSSFEEFELGRKLATALAHGGCAAVICNTVARAQRTYSALRQYFPNRADDGWPELDLLHARYPFEDRDGREKRALVRFGKKGRKIQVADGEELTVRRPCRAVLVATQLIEQSLDLDFDLMVSDPAPADLLLQRSGRLHRHPERWRPVGLDAPTLWVRCPTEVEAGPLFDRGTVHVYDEHVLLRTWLALRPSKLVRVPEDVADLIEAVYDDRPPPAELSVPLRERWLHTRERHDAELEAERAEATVRWVKAPSYSGLLWNVAGEAREEEAPDLHPAHQALTRLADPSIAVVCLYAEDGLTRLHPGGQTVDLSDTPTTDEAKRLLARSMTIAHRRVVFDLIASKGPQAWSRSPWLRHHRLLTLDTSGEAHIGPHRLRLDRDLGMVIMTTKEAPRDA